MGAVVEHIAGVHDTVIGLANLLVMFDPEIVDAAQFERTLMDLWISAPEIATSEQVMEIKVEYGGDYGPDLEFVAAHAGISEAEVVRLHQTAQYRVYALGSSPGFAYLGGLPEKIATPRRDIPILRAEAGSVMIGGSQTGVTSTAGPTGWYVIGRAQRRLFDPFSEEPCVLSPGDHVVFKGVDTKDASS